MPYLIAINYLKKACDFVNGLNSDDGNCSLKVNMLNNLVPSYSHVCITNFLSPTVYVNVSSNIFTEMLRCRSTDTHLLE